MLSPTHALTQCLEFASVASEAALRRCLEKAVSQLEEAQRKTQNQAQRQELGDATRAMLSHAGLWCRGYRAELGRIFAQTLHEKIAPAASAAASRSELTLVDDAEIVEAIASSRLLQHVLPLVERPVSELDALVSSALGYASVRPELNPMRPEVFAQALRSVLGRGPHTAIWLKYLAEPLGLELQEIYAKLVTQLNQAHVQAVGYRVSPGAEATHRPTGEASGFEPTQSGEDASAPRYRSRDRGELSGRQISQVLLRDFLAHGLGPEAAQPLPPSYYAEVDHELRALQAEPDSEQGGLYPAPVSEAYRQLPAVDRPARDVGVKSALDAQAWGAYARSRQRALVRSQLRKDATQVGQVLGLELVRKVVDQVAQDPRLLAPVREAIVALEPSLLRLAMVDPRFVSEESHPGRWLMERVAQRSFRYNDEFDSAFIGFFEEVRTEFNGLNALAIENSQPFQEALSQLEGRWLLQDQQETDRQQPAIDAVQFAERRQAEAEQIAWDLSARSDLADVPETVQAFLFGPWALVMAHARLTNKTVQPDPQGYTGVITDLLWSVKREVTLKQPAQLFERVPRLVATLRSGLASIGQEPVESEPFFQALMKLHHPVLKLRRAKTRRDARESGNVPLHAIRGAQEAPIAAAPIKKTEGEPWMSPRELDAAGFQETLPTDMAELAELAEPMPSAAAPLAEAAAAAQPSPAPATSMGQDLPDLVLAQLREGDWVDLYSKREWLRAQLIWAGRKAALFMFISHGGRPHSMTRRICERLIRERFLRPVRTHAVVTQALETIGRQADGAPGDEAPARAAPAARQGSSRSRTSNSAFTPAT